MEYNYVAYMSVSNTEQGQKILKFCLKTACESMLTMGSDKYTYRFNSNMVMWGGRHSYLHLLVSFMTYLRVIFCVF